MGLSVNTGPSWEEDSHGYINRATTEMNIREKYCEQRAGYDNDLVGNECLPSSEHNIMLTNPNIARKASQRGR
jgi:hypothetical protein